MYGSVSLLISAPRLGVYYFLSLTLSVCLSVCLFVTDKLEIDSSFLFLNGIAPFLAGSSPWTLYKTLFFNFWFRPPNAQNLLLNICTKSPISWLVCQIDRRCLALLGVFRNGRFNGTMQNVGRPLLPWQRNFGKFGLFFHKIAYKSACMPDSRICLGLPGGPPAGPTIVTMATIFGRGAESNRLLACLFVCLFVCL